MASRKMIKKIVKKYNRQDIIPLVYILCGILGVTVVSRVTTYLILVKKDLPHWLFLRIGDYRLHHFVYGNILILITSFFAIGLGTKKYKHLFAALYGIGLGLIFDEFLLWLGNINQLTNYVLFIPHSMTAVTLASILVASIILYRLYKNKHA